MELVREVNGRRGRSSWALYRLSCLAEEARVLCGFGDGRWRGVGLGRVYCQRKKKAPRWGQGVSEEEEEAAYRFGARRCWAVGCFGGWADLVPLDSFLFSNFLFLFFSDFLICFI
jgi:hypothetical protein